MKKAFTFIVLFVSLTTFSVKAQLGKDGAKVVSAANTIINEFTTLTANAASGSTSITVANSALNTNARFAANLAANDLVMIIQMQGASIKNAADNTWGDVTSYNNCGLYEFREVLSVPNATTINFNCPLVNNYTASGKVQVVRIPRYTSLTVNSGGVLTTTAWNGTIGGIACAEVLGNVVINAGGKIDVTGMGFRGGAIDTHAGTSLTISLYSSLAIADGGEKGEGIAGYQADYDPVGGRFCRGAAANGGGGANGHNSGGGGGSNAGTLAWTGDGNPDISTASWASAWNLEAPGFANSTSGGGGRGGYDYSSGMVDPLTVPPGNTSWQGDNRLNVGGKGGRPLNYSTGRIFLGGGGGGGHSNDGWGTPGANGGGIVYLTVYGSISGAGNIIADGNNTVGMGGTTTPCVVGGPCNQAGCVGTSTNNGVCSCSFCGGGSNGIDGAGGAGGGGVILLNSVGGANGISTSANGGKGGDQNTTATNGEAEGPGGGGGGGYIAITSGNASTSVKGGNNGTTNAVSMPKFIPNGATKGGNGQLGTITVLKGINYTICPNTSTTIGFTGTPPAGSTVTWTSVTGTVLGTGLTYTTPNLSATTVYLAKICPGATIVIDTVYMKSCGPTVTATGVTICSGATGNISATATGGTAPYTYTWSPATGLNSSTGTPIVASSTTTTTYTVTAKDNTGATATATALVTVNPVPTVSIPPATICNGTSTTLTASGATTYTWSPATGLSSTTGTSVTANPTTTTTYTVTGSFATGCTGTTTVVVTVNPVPVLSVPPATICQGQNTVLTASGATNYSWSPSTGLSCTSCSTVTANPTVTTTYTVIGSFATGCSASATVVVTVTPPCGPSITATGMTVCNGTCSTATSTASGGVPPYIYSWSNGATTSAINVCPTATTSYTVTVTDNSTPVGSATAIAVITVNPNPVVTVPPATICAGTTTTLNASGATTYSWTPATGLNTTTGATVNANPTTTTSYTVTGTNPTGCTGTVQVTVTVNPIPVVTVPNANICPGGSTPLTASGATTYTWSPVTGLSSGTGTTVTASPAVTTTYTVIGTSAGCTASTTVTVTVGALVATVSPNKTICFGASTQLTAGGGTIFSWTPATGLDNPNIFNPIATPTVTTTYTVVVSDAVCSDDAVVTITVNPAITLNVAPVNVTCFGACNGQTIVIPTGGTSPYTYSWSGGCTGAACSNVCAGTYSLTATDVIGCTATGVTTVTEPIALTMSVTGQTNVSCFGVCDGTASVSASGGTTPYNYLWTPGGNATANATGLCAGTYTCTVTDANNCLVKTNLTITQPTKISVTSNGASICPNGSATLSASATGGSGTVALTWSPATGLNTTSGASVNASPAITTVYTITGTDANGCMGTTSVTVMVNPAPVVGVPAAAICEGTSTTLTASGATTYSWSPIAGLSSTSGATLTAGPTVTTTYTVIGTNSFGCTGSTTVVVTVNQAPVITTTNGNVCPGDTATLTAGGAVSYTWIPASGLNAVTGSTVIANPINTTTYTITGTGANGCTATALATASVHPKPKAGFMTSPDHIDVFNPTVYFTDQSVGGPIISWNWSLGDLKHSGSTLQNPVYTYPDSIACYDVSLIVTNQFGCVDSTMNAVCIKGIFTFFIPNTFTPNSDGTNDGFLPKGTGIDITDYNLWIFDRWGNLIWQTNTWGEAWDGRANNGANVAQIDTYVWKVHVKELDSHAIHNYIGHVNIVK